jgi:hypothetical protein
MLLGAQYLFYLSHFGMFLLHSCLYRGHEHLQPLQQWSDRILKLQGITNDTACHRLYAASPGLIAYVVSTAVTDCQASALILIRRLH